MATRPDNRTALNLALELLKRIPRKRKVSARELQEELKEAGIERTLRSIQRQLEMLVETFDIECDDTASPYGYRWKEGAKGLSLPSLTEQEALLLLLARQHLAHLLPASLMNSMGGFFEQARRTLERHQTSEIPKAESQWLKKVRVVSTTVPMLPPQIGPGVFEELSSAIYKDQWLEIKYCNAKGQIKQKKVMPLGIAQQGQRLFVPCIFWGYTDIRNIAVHRISQAKNTGQPFERPKDFDLETYDDSGRFGYGKAEKIDMKLWINDYLKLLLEETPLSANQIVLQLADNAPGWELIATVTNSMLLVWWLRSQGSAVRVLEPLELAERI